MTNDANSGVVEGRRITVVSCESVILRVCVRGKRKMSNVMRADDVDGSWCRANYLFCDVKGRE